MNELRIAVIRKEIPNYENSHKIICIVEKTLTLLDNKKIKVSKY